MLTGCCGLLPYQELVEAWALCQVRVPQPECGAKGHLPDEQAVDPAEGKLQEIDALRLQVSHNGTIVLAAAAAAAAIKAAARV
jgi:hypothetical protein